jgi:hypothetical protein
MLTSRKVTNTQQHYMQISHAKFHSYQIIHVETIGRNLFMPLKFKFSWNNHPINFFRQLLYWMLSTWDGKRRKSLILNFIQVSQSESKDRNSVTLLNKIQLSPIFIKITPTWKFFVKNSYTQFHENPAAGLATNTRPQKNSVSTQTLIYFLNDA